MIVPNEQVLQHVAATCTVRLRDQNGDGAAAGGTVTVDIATLSGTTVATGRATSAGTGTGGHTAAITASETADLDILVLTWKDGSSARATTYVEIQGAVYASLAELAEFEPSLTGPATSRLRKAFREAVEECERCTGVAWVPRYRRDPVNVDSWGCAVLPTPHVRALRDGIDSFGNDVDVDDVAIVDAVTGKVEWLPNVGPLTLGWEHGQDRPPEELLAAVARRTRYRMALSKNPDQDRQARFVIDNGQTIGFAAAGPYRTGDDEVDSVYERFGMRVPGLA